MLIAGVDEVGRGCLAGPVIAAAVILDPQRPISGLADSKTLTPKRRKVLSNRIKTQALAWAVGRTEASEIDQINILQASLLAMSRAYVKLEPRPQWVNVDGPNYPPIPCQGEAIIHGDSLIPEISAASILAKEYRDGEMVVIDALFPGYYFAKHKGYPTKFHLSMLQRSGICPLHRKSFKPVKLWIDASTQIDPRR